MMSHGSWVLFALPAILVPASAPGAEIAADVFYVPHYKVFISDPAYGPGQYDPRAVKGGGRGVGLRLESLPEGRHGWVFHGEYRSADGSGAFSDAEQLRLGIGGQLGRAKFRAAVYAEYSRISLDAGHIDGAGIQWRFNFRHLDPVFFNVQLGHQCLEGDLRLPTGDDTLGFDLAELMVNVGYRLNDRISLFAEARRAWEVLSPQAIDLNSDSYHIGVRFQL